MLKRYRSLGCGNHVDVFLLGSPHPRREFVRVRNSGRKQDEGNIFWEHDDDLLPNHATFEIVHVVHLVKYNILHVSDDICTTVKHAPQDLRSHDQTARLWSYLHIARKNSDVIKSILEISKLLIA